MILLLVFLGMLFLAALNVPIAVALGAVAVLAMAATQGTDVLPNVGLVMYNGATSFPLLAIPMFILTGAIMNASGISRRLIAFASAILGFIRGGLSLVTIAATMFFAEISGSAVADVAALGSILIPAMKQRGYLAAFATAVTSSSSTLAVIIPPSIPMILYAVVADTSVTQLFVAGIVPGILGGILLMIVAYRTAVRRGYPVEEAFQLRRVARTFREAVWALTLPVIILGGIFGGIVTATEGAAVAVLTSLALGLLIYRELNWRELRDAMIDGAVQTAVVMLLVAASALLGVYLTEVQAPQKLANAILGWTTHPLAVLALLNVMFLFLGLFLHSAAAILLVVPMVLPLIRAVGIDPVQFGLIVTINLGIGQQTPPVASVLMTACSVSGADMWEVSKINVRFVGVLLLLLLIVTYVPLVPMSLVRMMYP